MSARLAAITGGAGFIGHHLAATLVAEGTRVRVLDTAPRPPGMSPAIEYVEGSVCDGAACRRVFEGADEVYHLAGIAHLWVRDPHLFDAVNGEGTRTVLDAARAAAGGVTVVTSTEVILRGWRDRDPRIDETIPPPSMHDLAGPYSRSKAKAHALALEAAGRGQDVRIVYPTVPVGAGDRGFTSPTAMIRDFLNHPPPVFLDCRLNLVDVRDVVRGHILAARQGQAGGRYILGGEDLWMHQILALLEDVSGRAMPRRTIPFALALAAGAVSTVLADTVTGLPPRAPLEGVRLACAPRSVDTGHARAALGYAPAPVRGALAAAVAWLAENGHLAKGLDFEALKTAKKAP